MRRVLALSFCLSAAPAFAQAPPPPAAAPAPAATPAPRAPRETVIADIGGQKVAIEYGRPSLRGRAMPELLSQLPADRIWRAGVDQATTFNTPIDLMIGDKLVPAGKYTLYLHVPAEGNYALVLNKDPGVPLKTIFPAAPPELADALWPRLSDYSAVTAKEVARIPLTTGKAKEPMDRFLIAFDPAVNGQSGLNFTWGEQSWRVPVKSAVKR
jgi:hypothetical protein